MLTPDYFETIKWGKLVAVYDELQVLTFRDAAELLKNRRKPEARIRGLIGIGAAELENRIAKAKKASERKFREMIEEAVLFSLMEEMDDFEALGVDVSSPLKNKRVRNVLETQWRKASGELSNLTRTTVLQGDRDARRLLTDAEMRVASGLQSYDQACVDVLDGYASSGVLIDYPAGMRQGVENAVKACVITGMNQTAAEITNGFIREGKVEYVLTSAHFGARIGKPGQPPCGDHSGWQGRVFKVDGGTEEFPNLLEATGYDIDANGKGRVVNPLGLHGYNCRHSHKPFDPSRKNPYRNEKGELLDGKGNVITDEMNREAFNLSQRQRARERSIKAAKRNIAMKQAEIDAGIGNAETLKAELSRMERRLERQSRDYVDFCSKNGLVPQEK